MKVVYIAHPIGGDVKENINKIDVIVRIINLSMPGIIPFVPYHADVYSLNDDNPGERKRGIANSMHFINTRYIEELWLFGDKISVGMWNEIEAAHQRMIKVVPKTEATRSIYRNKFKK